jgi:hypothetical protein
VVATVIAIKAIAAAAAVASPYAARHFYFKVLLLPLQGYRVLATITVTLLLLLLASLHYIAPVAIPLLLSSYLCLQVQAEGVIIEGLVHVHALEHCRVKRHQLHTTIDATGCKAHAPVPAGKHTYSSASCSHNMEVNSSMWTCF